MSSREELLAAVQFNADGLVPAIAQQRGSGQVLMMAWMNRASLERTLDTGKATYYSRSRAQLWTKGEESGNTQVVLSIAADCDGDTLLLEVDQTGPACHTGTRTCFDTTSVDIAPSSDVTP